MFRAAHSLKGAARAVETSRISSRSASRSRICSPRGSGVRALPRDPRSMRHTRRWIAWADVVGSRLDCRQTRRVVACARRCARVAPKPQRRTAQPAPNLKLYASRSSSLDARLVEAEEMLSAKLDAGQRAEDLSDIVGRLRALAQGVGARSCRLSTRCAGPRAGLRHRSARRRGNLNEFFDWTLTTTCARSRRKVIVAAPRAEQDRLDVGKLVDDLLENSKKLLMLPLATLGTLLHKIVRDLCRDQGKEAELDDPRRRREDRQAHSRGDERSADPSAAQLRSITASRRPSATRVPASRRARPSLCRGAMRWQPGRDWLSATMAQASTPKT